MKQIILPVAIPVVLILILKTFVSAMQTPGMILLAIIGVLAGIILNGVIFKKDQIDEQETN